MKTSENGIKEIEVFEGLRLNSYQDSAGGWTIGYGHTHGVKEGETITQSEAEAFLKADVEAAENAVNSLVKISLNQNEFDSLVSFQFNTGGLEGSTLLTLLNEGNKSGAAEELLKWVHITVDGVKEVSQGLLNRRESEKKLFLTPVKVVAATKPAQVFKPGQNIYTIQSGDTLTYISQKTRVPVPVLARYNDIENPDIIEAGEKLKIPKAIEVRSGDYLGEIARRNGEPLDFIVKVNAIEKPNLIHIGQTIWI